MDWTIEQIFAFVTAAEEGSFSAAARALGKAQSVVSTHIASLEDTLGVELFDRSSRSPVLTEAGQDLLPEARAVLRQIYRFESTALAKVSGEALHLDVSVSHGISFNNLSETVAKVMRKYPYITGSFRINTADKVRSDVREGRSQIGLVLGVDPPDRDPVERICLGHVQYCVVASKDSPLAKLSKITAQELSQQRQILVDSDTKQWLLSSKYWLVNNEFWAAYLASLGVGWTVVPLDMVQRLMMDRAMQNLVILNPWKYNRPVQDIWLIWNSVKFNRQDILETFCQDLQKSYSR